MSYQIKDWDKHFENGDAARYKSWSWLPLPNQHDGKKWGRLWKLDRAPEIFAAFILLLELASKMPERGVLADDEGELSTGDMASKTQAPQSLFDFALPRLVELNWLVLRKSAQTCGVSNITEPNITKPNRTNITIPAPAAFFERIISLNYHGPQAVSMLSDFRSMPRLSTYKPTEGVPEAMLYVLESVPTITKKYPKFKIYAFLQKAVNEKFSLLALAGAMKALIDLQHAPQDMAPYWQSLIRNEKAQLKCWENEIWPTIKHGKYKLQ